MCENYTGDTCRGVIGEALISNVHSPVPGLERTIQGMLKEVENSSKHCQNYYKFVHCVSYFKPCDNKMWCGHYTLEQLAKMACHCVSHPCYKNVTSVIPQGVLAVNTSLYAKHGHAQNGKQCEAIEIGKWKSYSEDGRECNI